MQNRAPVLAYLTTMMGKSCEGYRWGLVSWPVGKMLSVIHTDDEAHDDGHSAA